MNLFAFNCSNLTAKFSHCIIFKRANFNSETDRAAENVLELFLILLENHKQYAKYRCNLKKFENLTKEMKVL